MAWRSALLAIAMIVVVVGRALIFASALEEGPAEAGPSKTASLSPLETAAAGYPASADVRDWAGVCTACESLAASKPGFAAAVAKTMFGVEGLNISVCTNWALRLTPSCGLNMNPTCLAVADLLSHATLDEAWESTAKSGIVAIATHHNVSVADTVAVCTAISVEMLTDGLVKVLNRTSRSLRVGRLDSPTADLAPPALGDSWTKFWCEMSVNAAEAGTTLRGALNHYGHYASLTAKFINGHECPVPWAVDGACSAKAGHVDSHPSCAGCLDGTVDCHKCCRCPAAFSSPTEEGCVTYSAGHRARPRRRLLAQGGPSIATPAPPAPALTPGIPVAVTAISLNPRSINPRYPAPMAAVPPSPYDKASESCSARSVEIRGYPSSPRTFAPFQLLFRNRPALTKALPTVCKPTTSNPRSGQTCVDTYSITVVQTTIDLGIGCGAVTRALAYNGIVPGPTIEAAVGTQTIVRFINTISPDSTAFPAHAPCNTTARRGRPMTIHLHGSASLAPYDGWAEDSICFAEAKDYVYPNQRPNTEWYHDHELDITGENAHAGLAGFYLIKQQSALGTAPDRWGLDGMQEYHLMLADRVVDAQCQLRYEPEGVHRDNHHGDINLVSGIPFPRIEAEPKWVRFRVLNAAVSRPYLLALVNIRGEEVSNTLCYMLASDGGYRRLPVPFPAGGLFMGVAERYEFTCNLAPVRNQTLYLWNVFDDKRMKHVPFFCHSHLVAQVVVSVDCLGGCATQPAFQFPNATAEIATHLDAALTRADYARLRAQAIAGRCDRTMVFGRGGGQWVINGETWQTARIAARNVSLNSPEIWCLEGKGGWFHPIHIHLIDMFVLTRFQAGAYPILETYETDVPKDVVELHPGSRVAILARWGPHRGEYMFHCHNLRHEDNAMMRTLSTDSLNARALADSPALAQISQLSFTSLLGTQVYDNYRDPRYPPAAAKPIGAMPDLRTFALGVLNAELYRIFYPGVNERNLLCDLRVNPWRVSQCPDCREVNDILNCTSIP